MAEEQIPGSLQGALQAALGGTLTVPTPTAPSPAPKEAQAEPAAEPAKTESPQSKPQQRPQGNRENRPSREGSSREGAPRQGGGGRPGGDRPGGDRPGGGGGDRQGRGGPGGGDRPASGDRGHDRGPDRGGDRRPSGGGERRYDGPPDIELDKLIGDSLYLDNQAHIVVSRIRDMDSGTRSQLRRLYNAVRRATRAPESERQHEFVMLRARLAYTIARHGLRSLDQLERLLLQVTRKNEARGYERFRDLFEAIVAYNE